MRARKSFATMGDRRRLIDELEQSVARHGWDLRVLSASR
jgi:hypothetical protein